MLRILPATTKEELGQIKDLFIEYARSLRFDLSFQNFERELTELPGEYAPPTGRLLLALYDSEIAGCVALRRISDEICEMKRLFVRKTLRGRGIGKELAMAIIEEAHGIGYTYMRLDTVPEMKEAISLYCSLDFKEIEPYRYNPISGARYMELDLKKGHRAAE